MDDPTQTEMWEAEKDEALNGNMAESDDETKEAEPELEIEVAT